MLDDEDWIMRPVIEGACKYESLKDCTLDLEDIARIHAALDVKEANLQKRREMQEKEHNG